MMTPLMMLALTLPPSIAFVLERWMAGREAQARKLAAEQVGRIDALKSHAEGVDIDIEGCQAGLDKHEAELKRLAEQVSLLADRYR